MSTTKTEIACDGPDLENADCPVGQEQWFWASEDAARAELSRQGWRSLALVDPHASPVVFYIDQCPACVKVAAYPDERVML